MKKRYSKAVIILFASILMLQNTVGALNTNTMRSQSEHEILISAEMLNNSKIAKESDSLITITSSSASTVPSTRAASADNVYSTNIDIIALLINDSSKTDEIYQGLVTASDEASSYKTKSNYVAGLTIHSTVYYTIQEADGYEWYHLEAIEVGNNKSNPNSNVIGSGFVIGTQSVTYGVQGANLEGQNTSGQRATVDLDNKNDYFYIKADDSWPTIGSYFGVLGACYSVDIVNKRDGSHILMELSNNPIDSISFPGW